MLSTPFIFRFQVTPFVILFVERAGSTYLVTALKSHPEVLALTEKFDALRQEGKSAEEQLVWAQRFLRPPLIGRYRAIGFKTKLLDVIDPNGFARLLHILNCKVIRLQRRNSIKAVVSTLNARRQWEVSGNWNLLNESNRLSAFAIDVDEFDTLLKQRQKLDQDLEDYVKTLRLPTLTLFYEDLLGNQDGFVRKVFTFLGVKQTPATGITLKNTKDDLREAILNFEKLKAQYRGTQYEPMFDEGLLLA